MSVKNEAKLWLTPSGQVAPKLTDCNNSAGFGYAVGQLPLDTTDIPDFLAPFIDSKYHPRFQTASPQVQFINNKWEKVGNGLGCNDSRRPQIDFSNFADNSCPAISMVGPAQQLLKSTENLLDSNHWKFRDSGQINTVTNDIDAFGEQNVFKHTATTPVSTNQLSGSFYQGIGYNNNAQLFPSDVFSYSVFVKRGTQDMNLGLICRFYQGTADNRDNYAIFDFDTEQVRIKPNNLTNSNDYNFNYVNVERYPNGWYRVFIRHQYRGTNSRYFALYPLKKDVTPQQWQQNFENNDYTSHLATAGQFYYLSKPNVTIRGKRITSPPETENSWAFTAGYEPYVPNTSGTNVVFKQRTGFRSFLPYDAGDNYSFYFDIYIPSDTPKRTRDVRNDFFVSEVGKINSPITTNRLQGIFNVILNSFNSTFGDHLVPLDYDQRHKIVFQNREVWINGVRYDSDLDRQIGTPFGYVSSSQQKYWELKANQRFFIHNLGVWNRQLTPNEILSL